MCHKDSEKGEYVKDCRCMKICVDDIVVTWIWEMNIKTRTYYFFDDIINIKNLDPNNIKIDEKSYKNLLTYYIGYMTPNNIKHLYHIINIEKRYIKESNWNNYLTLVPTDESRDKLKKYEQLWSKINDLIIRSRNNNSDDYDEKYMKIKFSY